MEIKIKVGILAKPNLASLMQHEKKPVDGASKLLASMLTRRLLLVKNCPCVSP